MIELTVSKTSDSPSVFSLSPQNIDLGGKQASGVDFLRVSVPPDWQGKTVRITFVHTTNSQKVSVILPETGIVKLTSDITSCSGDIVIDAAGTDNYAAYSTGCHYTVYNHPDTGSNGQVITPDEYHQFVGEVKNYSDLAQTNATAANASKEASALSEQNAKNSETASLAAQQAAETNATAAQCSAGAAARSEVNSKSSETAAKTSETNSANSAIAAARSEVNSKSSETAAKTSETNSANSAIAAAGSATAAETAKEQAQAAIIINPQSWTNDQKSTARTNINVPSISDIDDLRAQFALYDDSVIGVQADFKNSVFTRLCGAKNLTAGSPFDKYHMFGGRKRCNVSDNGTITAYYGDANYKEDGSNGQVMVYQPSFYYKVAPLALEPISNGIGYHLRKANYYISDNFVSGFKLHPAFYDANGHAVNYILCSAFEGSIFDTSANAYLLHDEQVMDNSVDKFCSIAGAKPASGLTQDLTRPKVEQMAQNRGTGWHSDTIKAESANQLLMIIELGTMNTQTAIENGVVSTTDNTSYNCSSLTGSTASLGNGTGAAIETINEIGGVNTTYNINGKRSITYRGVENPWGNIYKFVYGVNIYYDIATGEHQAYICSNFAFAESKKTDNYVGAGFTLSKTDGYISAMGYSEDFDWLFMPSECTGASNLPVGDYFYRNTTTTGYRIAYLGGRWYYGNIAGGFCWNVINGVSYRNRDIGGRLVYIPTAI